ncbi:MULTISPECIES: hypothetical protein [unclassified Mesorhizobium]|uniref:hypothetical protein n=1 Tax=unclassified Mesorhizobium TaxID=325217 RepID=UPI0010939577|nr:MULTISPECIES: hypothetical protein [unclassified Mesorhizobium]TGT90870.1 hypothetical protein EN804_05915 [Mesorhizobium sp. M8A.F.Ca.ET.161.01.1.1]TGV43850.1 hypothetical protein EN785_07630 [Mesorhizobium sp. M8A.F.Ca.ET.142.01.1.1]
MNDLLLNAYRFHRFEAVGNVYPARKGYRRHNPANEALKAARRDVAAYAEALAAGDTKTASRFRRYPRDHYAAVTWQKRDTESPSYAKRAECIAFVQDFSGAGLRHVGNVEADTPRGKIWSNRDSCGWYSDYDQSETIYGVVYQLPGRDGKARFVAGYASAGDCDGLPTLDFGAVYSEDMRGDRYNESAQDLDAARDAARAADSMAQSAAEDERAYKAAWQAGSQFAERAETIAANRKAALELLAERRRAATAGKGEAFQAICGAIRDKVDSLLAEIAEARAERKKLKAGDYISEWLPGFYSGDKRLKSAFNEGAGKTIFPC